MDIDTTAVWEKAYEIARSVIYALRVNMSSEEMEDLISRGTIEGYQILSKANAAHKDAELAAAHLYRHLRRRAATRWLNDLRRGGIVFGADERDSELDSPYQPCPLHLAVPPPRALGDGPWDPPADQPPLMQDINIDALTAPDSIERAEIELDADRILEALSPDDRQLLIAYFGLRGTARQDVTAIMAAMGLSRREVMRRVNRALTAGTTLVRRGK